jgi:ribosome-associated protein
MEGVGMEKEGRHGARAGIGKARSYDSRRLFDRPAADFPAARPPNPMKSRTPLPPEDTDADDDQTPFLDPGKPSKTRRKQASHDLQELGEALMELPASRLAKLDLSDTLRDAIDELRRVRSHEGRRRHLQYIGKLMRHVDPEPLREAVAANRLPSAKETLALHEAERWRLQLVSDDGALTTWLREHPETDAQTLRSLIRAARKDRAEAQAAAAGSEPRKSRAWRELFQIVKAGLAGDATAAPADDDDSGDDTDD